MTKEIKQGVIFFRNSENGIEVFLVPGANDGELEIPTNAIKLENKDLSKVIETIELDDHSILAYEIEEDNWELPLQSILGKTESPLQLRRKHRTLMEKGTYYCIKSAIKKVFPNQVSQLKELHEILATRNSIINL